MKALIKRSHASTLTGREPADFPACIRPLPAVLAARWRLYNFSPSNGAGDQWRSAVEIFDVPSAVDVVGAVLAAQLRIGVVDDAGAARVRRESGGIPGDGLGVGRQVRRAVDLFLDVAVDHLLSAVA